MSKFRKVPVVIDAVQWDGTTRVAFNIAGELHMSNWAEKEGGLYIFTPEGEMRADPGDWIIKGVKGEFYPCKPDIFDMTYEPVEDAE